METYNIQEAADALGRSMSSLRRWIKEDIVPTPILTDANRPAACYCVEELEIICRHLQTHEEAFANLCKTHSEVITRLSQAIHGFRDIEFSPPLARTRA